MSKKNHIKVCVHYKCCQQGSQAIYRQLKGSFEGREDTEVIASTDCFRFCKSGPNVSVNGNILHGIRSNDAVGRVKRELEHPSRRIDGLGTRSIDELDDVLDGLL